MASLSEGPGPATEPNQEAERSTSVASSPGGTSELDTDALTSGFSSSFQEATFILVIGFSQLFSAGSLGNTAYSVEQIGHALGVTSNGQKSWFLAAYSMCAGVFVLVAGRLGDHLGHKYVFLFGWIWMAIWSLISGFANNVALFDFTRAMTGIGSAALAPNSFALLARGFPPFSAKKNIAFSFLGFCAPSGYVFGGLIGAGFAESVTWRWGFWFWAIGCFVLAGLTFIVVPHRVGSAIPGLSFKQFDYLGSFLGVSGLVVFAFAWNQASVVGWQEPYTYILLIIGIVLLIAFPFSQARAVAPVMPNSLWSRRGFLPVVAAMIFGWMSFGIFLYYTTIFILNVHREPPLAAVAQMVPLVIGGFIATGSVAIFIPRVRAEYIFGVSMFAFLVGNLLMSFCNYTNVYWAFIFPSCLLVVGGPDLSFASASILMSNAVLPEEQGVAGSFISTVVQYSISFGLGISATVEVHVNKDGSDVILGYRTVYWLGVGLAAISFIIVLLFVRDHRFDSEKDEGGSTGEESSAENPTENPTEKIA